MGTGLMATSLLPVELQQTERKLRLLAILDSCRHAGLSPTSIAVVHTIAYLADALAPVWDLPILDGQILKRKRHPFFPALQRDLDLLVGQGVVQVARVRYLPSEDRNGWQLDAHYMLESEFSERILSVARSHELQARKLKFIREVVYAASGLGSNGIDNLGEVDAAYSDPLVDVGGLLDIDTAPDRTNATAEVALRFSKLTQDSQDLTNAELVHLYVRHLYARMQVA
jgi:hypothetical protein